MRRADHPLAPTFVLEAPDVRTVKRLATLCRMRFEEFCRCFDVRCIFDERPNKGWDQRRAELAGERLSKTFQRDKRVVVVGRAKSVISDHALVFQQTSPGLASFWDDVAAREQASTDLRAFLGLK